VTGPDPGSVLIAAALAAALAALIVTLARG
jgi:hypothetical protein